MLNDTKKKLLCGYLIAHIHVNALNLTKLVPYLYLMNVGMKISTLYDDTVEKKINDNIYAYEKIFNADSYLKRYIQIITCIKNFKDFVFTFLYEIVFT